MRDTGSNSARFLHQLNSIDKLLTSLPCSLICESAGFIGCCGKPRFYNPPSNAYNFSDESTYVVSYTSRNETNSITTKSPSAIVTGLSPGYNFSVTIEAFVRNTTLVGKSSQTISKTSTVVCTFVCVGDGCSAIFCFRCCQLF